MKKYEFTFLQRLKHFAVASLNVFIVIPIFILLFMFATFFKFIHCGVIGVIKSGIIWDTPKRIAAIFFVWLCIIKNLFKQNRRNIALCLCVLKPSKSGK
jgi:hypothetical protein